MSGSGTNKKSKLWHSAVLQVVKLQKGQRDRLCALRDQYAKELEDTRDEHSFQLEVKLQNLQAQHEREMLELEQQGEQCVDSVLFSVKVALITYMKLRVCSMLQNKLHI